MNISNQHSPNFQMKVKGLEHPYFSKVSNKMKNELVAKAEAAKNTDFTVEFLPAPDNWVFLKKTIGQQEAIVDYFPLAYKPEDIVKTFTKTYIPERRIAAKTLRNTNFNYKALVAYKEHFKP